MNTSGAMVTGWQKSNGKWYYLKANGAMAENGWQWINGNYFYFYDNGMMAENTTIDNYVIDGNGICLYFIKDGIIVANKKHPLSKDYAPGEDATAGNAIRQLIKDMQNLGYNISSSYSGYRSYSYQAGLYNGYVASYGQASADTFSARPGYSEHQLGLAFDLIDGYGNLVESSAEVNWIKANAYKYGFIVRYTEAKQSITGYMAEPWHLRYVDDKAWDIYKSGLTLEEYLGVSGGDYY